MNLMLYANKVYFPGIPILSTTKPSHHNRAEK